MLLNSKKSLKRKMLTFKKMTKRDLMVGRTRHHHAHFLKYYPRRHCAPSLVKSRFFLHTTNLLTVRTFSHFEIPYVYIHAGNPRMPPRVLASGPKPCGGNNLDRSVVTRKSETLAYRIDLAIARSIRQGLSLRFSRNDLTLGY